MTFNHHTSAILLTILITGITPVTLMADAWSTKTETNKIGKAATDTINMLKGDVGPVATEIWLKNVEKIEASMPKLMKVVTSSSQSKGDIVGAWNTESKLIIERWSTSIENFKIAAKNHNPKYRESTARYWKPMTEEYAMVIGDIEEYGLKTAEWKYETIQKLSDIKAVLDDSLPKLKIYKAEVDAQYLAIKRLEADVDAGNDSQLEWLDKWISKYENTRESIDTYLKTLAEFYKKESYEPDVVGKKLKAILAEWEIDALDYTYVSSDIIKFYPLFNKSLNRFALEYARTWDKTKQETVKTFEELDRDRNKLDDLRREIKNSYKI